MTTRHKSWRWMALVAATAALVAAAMFAAACGDDDDEDNGGTTPTTQATRAATQPASSGTQPTADGTQRAGGGDTLSTAENAELGTILVGPDGLTLYTFTNDMANSGTSACYNTCAANWPALTVEGEPTADTGIDGEVAAIMRTDGTTQVTYNGMPLYYFANDNAPGDTNGHEVAGVWFVAQP